MADNVPKLGELISTHAERDAVHVAVVPVEAHKTLKPGQHVGAGMTGEAYVTDDSDPIGVVDPYLKTWVKKGQRCYLFLYPNTVVSLRHVYRHPVLDAEIIRRETIESLSGASVKRLQEIAEKDFGITYEDMMKGTARWLKTGEAVDTDGWTQMNPEPPEDFWPHYEMVTGAIVPEDKKRDSKNNLFSCEC